MTRLKEGQKSIRVVLPEVVYGKVKRICPEHGDISRLVRKLLLKHLNSGATLAELERENS